MLSGLPVGGLCWAMPPFPTASRMLVLLLPLAGLGCTAGIPVTERFARESLVGLPIDDLRLCAGVPDREATSPAGLFWTYDRSPPSASVSLPVPVVGGAVNLSRGADCRVTFQLVDGHVARIGHSTGTARGLAQDPACAPVIRACLRMVNPNPEPETPEPAAAIRR